ncbi:histidinol phosphate phosphatase [Clostridium swellfunianum]|uniref:histidinol phosphate phosphatase n=1 Tax=Clostridium swellfunianum TaxID=1367462 RepID=UPI00202ED9CE|nr:histidinol phosphate phosphatase [Clostridium swellfunianum]MCM0647748.1 histidinol phosphate phosphatase [Clostridium swellfunianum]
MFDTHMHTNFSTDSKMTIEAAIRKASELDIGIITTEHMDLNFPDKNQFIFDPDQYFNEYSKYRSDRVLLGIELGMITNQVEENRKVIESYPFDYVIGSVHLVDNMDVLDKNFYINRSKKDSYEHYFRYMLDCIKTHSFVDSIGHIDYISRYAVYEDKEIYYEDFSEYIDEVLKAVISADKALELNTRRLGNNDAINNLTKIYKRFYELGGRMITVGSDSHYENSIGFNFDMAKVIAENCKLKIVYFKERKPEFV